MTRHVVANVADIPPGERLLVTIAGRSIGVFNVDGRFYAEEVRAGTSRYVVIGRGVIMIAEGGVTMDQARAAVETIGLQRLEALFGR